MRYYDPTIGRFITADTIIGQPYNPQSLNRYSYCDNNPINYTDPTGHRKWYQHLGFNENPAREIWNEIKSPLFSAAVVITASFVIMGPSAFSLPSTYVAASAAASATATLDTGEGRKAIRSTAEEVFDEALGMHPKATYITSSIVLHTALTLGYESAFSNLVANPAAGKRPYNPAKDKVAKRGVDPYDTVRFRHKQYGIRK